MRVKISVVTTMFYSSEFVCQFYDRVVKAVETITKDFEIIFVNDGSPDNSLPLAMGLREKDNRIKVINLSKNFGHHQAILTGLKYAKGDHIFLIDLDLEESPDLFKLFWKKMKLDNSIDVVYGVQTKRKGKLFERLSGYFFYKITNFFSDLKYPKDTTTARIMSREYVESVLMFDEKELDLWTIFILAGYNQVPVKVSKNSKGETTYTLIQKIKIGLNTITSTTSKPLYYVFLLGINMTFFSVLFIIYLLIKKIIFLDVIIEGWTSLIISVWFIGGVVTSSIGIVGIYLSKVFKEIKNRPRTIIKEIYDEEQ